MRAIDRLTISSIFMTLLLTTAAGAQNDFLWSAIVEIDSLARVEPAVVPTWVADHHWLVGAMVGELLDSAIEVGDAGDRNGEQENIQFALLLASAELERSGSNALTDLVATYSGWRSAAREIRVAAKRLQAKAAAADDATAKVPALESALELYRRIGDRRSEAILWGSLAVAHWYPDDVATISECLEKARAAREGIEDYVLLGRTLNTLGSLHYLFNNDYPKAEEYYRRAIAMRERTGDVSGLLGSWTYLGNSLRDQQRLHEATRAYDRASALAQSSDDVARRVQLLISQAGLLPELGQLRRSTQLYEEALQIARDLQDQRLQRACHMNLALNHNECRDYRTARAHLDTAQVLLEAQPDPDSEWEIQRNLCKIALAVDELDVADTHNRSALALARANDRSYQIIESLINRGSLFDRRGEPGSALTYAQEAERLARADGDLRLVREAVVLSAQVETAEQEYDAALAHWRWAAANDSTSQATGLLVEDRLGIANVLAMRGDESRARDLYRRQWREVADSGRTALLEPILFGLGHTFERSHPDSAFWYYEQAQAQLEDYRQSLAGDEFGTGFFSGLHRHAYEEIALYYATQAQVAESDPWRERAFFTIERAKSRGLRDLIARNALAESAPAAEAIIDSLYSLGPDADPGLRQQLEADYTDLRESAILDALGKVPVDRADVGIADLQRKLSQDTVVLAYALGDTASLCWAIDRGGADLYRLPGRDILDDRITLLQRTMQHEGLRESELRRVAHELHELLVAPATSRLSGAERIVVMPDGVLHGLPFEVLVEKTSQSGATWNDLTLLSDRYSITYTPSAAIYARETEVLPQDTAPTLIAVCNPDFTGFADAKPWTPLRMGCDPVETARVSVGASADSCVVLSGAKADEASFKEHATNVRPRILHLGTHGEVDEHQPEFSRIVFCPDAAGREDGYLYTLEILEQNIAAQIVVISACETARGRIGRGEGVIGLSRAFFATGSGCVIGSLWRVYEPATAELMNAFYSELLKNDNDPAQALNLARIALRKDPRFSHPLYWAGFVFIEGP